MPKLKKYEDHQKKVLPEPQAPSPSRVACTEKECEGEMMIWQPVKSHPELPQLRRASCGKCGWRGWV
jgi:hypothetical protein